MSYNPSMSPPPQKPAPRPFSPAAYGQPGAGSPPNPYGAPPAKRQRLSPDARSPVQNGGAVMPPYASSPHALPSVGYGNPYAQAQSPYANTPGSYSAGSPQNAYSPAQQYQPPPPQQQWTPQPQAPTPGRMSPPNPQAQQTPSSQMMPPPPRPNKEDKDERMNIDDIGDSMFGSGVNLKEEENYMHATFNNQHHGINNSFASTTQTNSFGSSTMSPNNSFNVLTQGTSFGSQPGGDGAFAGTIGQPQSEEQIENELKRKRAEATRERNDRFQHHLANQYLQVNCVRARLMRKAQEEGVQPEVRGLYRRLEDPVAQPHLQTMVNGDSGIVAADTRPEYTAGRNEPFEQMMSLVSLAAGERMRSLVDEAFALARARRYGDRGIVPPEFADIAAGEGRREEDVVPESVTGSQWDKIPDANGAVSTGEDSKAGTPQPQHTVSYADSLASTLRSIAKRDEAVEKERIKKREARRKAAQEAANKAEEEALDTPAAEIETAGPPKMTKKEQERQKKEKEAKEQSQSQTTTNQTAAMMAMGGKRSKYAWMMKGGDGGGLENKYAKPKPGASGTATPNAAIKSEAASPSASGMARGGSGQGAVPAEKVPDWGDWREDGPGGKGIQPRDWMYVLERDGKEKLALERAYGRLS